MTVKAWLSGHEFDLEMLADLLPDGALRVVKEGGVYCLVSDELDNPPSGVPYYEVAPALLQRINGMGRVTSSDFRPVHLSGRYTDGAKTHQVVSVGTAEERSKAYPPAVRVDGQQPTKPIAPRGPVYASLSATHPDVAEVLDILGGAAPAPNWVDLYKIYEIIRSNIQPTRIDKTGWITKAEDDAFTASANHPAVSGADARHARQKGGPPSRSMSLFEARQLIGRLVQAWTDWLRG